jgi:hypothetical protein
LNEKSYFGQEWTNNRIHAAINDGPVIAAAKTRFTTIEKLLLPIHQKYCKLKSSNLAVTVRFEELIIKKIEEGRRPMLRFRQSNATA